MKNQGFSDLARELFILNLKDYSHKIISGNKEQAILDLQNGEKYCFVGIDKNIHNFHNIEYSEPFLEILPNMFIFRKEDKKKFETYVQSNEGIDLYRLFQNNKYIFGFIKDRSYLDFIDELILKNKDKKHFLLRQKGEVEILVRFLNKNKIDYMFEDPVIVDYIQKEQDLKKEFYIFPIFNSKELNKLYVGCSQNEFGKGVIKNINNIINENKNLLESFYRTWLNTDSKKEYSDIKK